MAPTRNWLSVKRERERRRGKARKERKKETEKEEKIYPRSTLNLKGSAIVILPGLSFLLRLLFSRGSFWAERMNGLSESTTLTSSCNYNVAGYSKADTNNRGFVTDTRLPILNMLINDHRNSNR